MAIKVEKLSAEDFKKFSELDEGIKKVQYEKQVRAAQARPRLDSRPPAAPKVGAPPVWDVRFDIEAVSQRVTDSGSEVVIAAGKHDLRAFRDAVKAFDRTIDDELNRAVREKWPELDEEDRQIILKEIDDAAMYMNTARRRLESARGELGEMIAALDAVELPTAPLMTRVADAVKDVGKRLVEPMFRS